MRNRFLVSYDVCDPKRLRKTYKRMCGFGDPVQYSVFLCRLSAKERVLMLDALFKIIHQDADRVMVIDLGPVDGRGDECVSFYGRSQAPEDVSAVVV